MSKSKKKRSNPQAVKPYPDFPLTAHPSGRWCKKIKGKLFCFGALANPEAALAKFLDEKNDLYAGRVPRSKIEAGPTLRNLCNEFLTAKKDKLERGEITARTFYDLYGAAERLIKELGKDRLLTDIRAEDFAAMQRAFPKKWGPIRRGREIQCVRSIFNYGMAQGLIQTIVRFGDFKKPSKSVLRKAKAKARAANGLRMFEAEEIRALLDKAGPRMRSFILLALNAGLGPTDLASLTFSVLDLDRAWLDFPRIKSGVDRRCPLWTETVAAVKETIAARRPPKDPAHESLVFLTKYRVPWVRSELETVRKDKDDAKQEYRLTGDNALSKEFSKLARKIGLVRAHRGFYALRHTLQTVGGEARDPDALRLIMGHTDESMSDHYRERVADDRLKRIARHVHDWLFAKDTAPRILSLSNAAAL